VAYSAAHDRPPSAPGSRVRSSARSPPHKVTYPELRFLQDAQAVLWAGVRGGRRCSPRRQRFGRVGHRNLELGSAGRRRTARRARARVPAAL